MRKKKLGDIYLAMQARMRARRLRNLSTPDPAHVRRVAFLKLQKTGGTTFAASVLFPYCVRHGLNYMFPSRQPFNAITKTNVAPAYARDEKFHMLFRHFPSFSQEQDWLNSIL